MDTRLVTIQEQLRKNHLKRPGALTRQQSTLSRRFRLTQAIPAWHIHIPRWSDTRTLIIQID